MAIEEEKKVPIEDVKIEPSEEETADEIDQAELDKVSGGRRLL